MTHTKDEIENAMEFSYRTLDTIDFLPFIEKHRGGKFNDLRFEVEQKYDETELTNNEILEGCIFNWLTDDEIVEYLEKRYPNDFRYTEVSTMYIC